MTNSLTIDITAWGETHTCWVRRQSYSNGRLALDLWFEDDFGPAPYGKITVNLPDQHLNEGELFVKDWAENEPIASALLEAGWITPTGREVNSGFVFPLVARAAGPLKEFLDSGAED